MSLAVSIREQVCQRAQYACEFCGITEIDDGEMLTIYSTVECSPLPS